jgi:hypothetical protein
LFALLCFFLVSAPLSDGVMVDREARVTACASKQTLLTQGSSSCFDP